MRVNIDTKVLTDIRLVILAKSINRTKGEALGIMALLWMYCQESKVDILPGELIDVIVEKKNFTSIAIGSGLFEDVGQNRFRVKGVRERLYEQAKYSEKQSIKGKLSAEARSAKNQPRLDSGSTTVQPRFNPYSNSNSNSKSKEEDLTHFNNHSPKEDLAISLFADLQKAEPGDGQEVIDVLQSKPTDKSFESFTDDSSHVKNTTPVTSINRLSKRKLDHSKQRSEVSTDVIVNQKTPSWTSTAYDSWRMHYKRTYNAEPGNWSKAEWGSLKQLYEKAEKDIDKLCMLIEHYFSRRDYAFTASGHSLMKLLPSFHRLWAEVQNGRKITEQDIRNASRNEGNSNAGQMAIERIESGAKSNLERLDDIAAELIAEEKRIHQSEFRRAIEASREDDNS